MTPIKARFDGKVLVPEEPIELPLNQPLTLLVQRIEPRTTKTLLDLAAGGACSEQDGAGVIPLSPQR